MLITASCISYVNKCHAIFRVKFKLAKPCFLQQRFISWHLPRLCRITRFYYMAVLHARLTASRQDQDSRVPRLRSRQTDCGGTKTKTETRT